MINPNRLVNTYSIFDDEFKYNFVERWNALVASKSGQPIQNGDAEVLLEVANIVYQVMKHDMLEPTNED